MIDSHCHVAGPEFTSDLDAVIGRAREAGVSGALVILEATDAAELEQAGVVRASWPSAYFSVGVHPHAASTFASRPDDVGAHVASTIASVGGVRAVGECGLDYHYDLSPRPVQREVFRAQIRLAKTLGLPLVVHTRDAEEDTFESLRGEGGGEAGGVFHCFTGDRRMARLALDHGFHISLSGIVTFPKALELKEVAREVPLDRLLIETDSPFLAPVPHRGGRNEPARVAVVADAIAALRGLPREAVIEATSENFVRLFKP